jgi:hypothetical protein
MVMSSDALIVGIVAVAVFICLGYALPNRALYGSEPIGPEDRATSSRDRSASTRLSRRGAIAISLGLVTVFAAILIFVPTLDAAVGLAIVALSLWATVDSHKVKLHVYKTRIALRPISLFNAMIFFWPVLFPWYLIVCSKIGDGTLPRKSDFANAEVRE